MPKEEQDLSAPTKELRAPGAVEDLKLEIIHELGRSILLLGGKNDLLSTVWSIGDTIEDAEALELLRVVNDKKLNDLRQACELAATY